ncbi:MAG: hypothetical protein ACPGGB_10945, partial [Flavobacteriales bacterium]
MAGHGIVHWKDHHASLAHAEGRAQRSHHPRGVFVGRFAIGIQCWTLRHHDAVDDDFLSSVGDSLTGGGSALVIAADVEELTWLGGHV